jgi:O-succinylbenzoate synthase
VRAILHDHVVGVSFGHPAELSDRLAHLRGNRMAKAMVETALWDLHARVLGRPLGVVLGGHRDAVECGVSLGLQPSPDALVELVAAHVEQGYRRIKLKIKPGRDVDVLDAVRAAFPTTTLTADANSAYTLDDVARLRSLDRFELDYIEQPLGWDDLVDHATLQRELATPICLDESIVDVASARHAIQLGSAKVVNLKVGRVGGHLEAQRIDELARRSGIALWCGGMLETGVGRAHNIHLATLDGFTKPGDISSASRYWETDVVEQPLECVDGMMPVPSGAGIGVTLDRGAVRRFAVSTERF